ncbi:MAG: 50S ribosomal protein L24 [Chitinophagales bacterium]|nr:50S ribosomal protein L24 [Chitinophagales bacterium]
MKKKEIKVNRFKPKFHVKKNDMVEVIAGDDKGKKGRVIEVNYKTHRVMVEGVSIVSKHTRPNAQYPNGGIIKKEALFAISNVLLVNPSTGRGSRTGIKMENGKKQRIFREHPNKIKK